MATRSPRTEDRAARATEPNAPEKPEKSERAAHDTKARTKRVPLGVPRSKLAVPKRQGYERRWINDDNKGRLQNAKEGGYTHVVDPNLRVGEDGTADQPDSRVSRIVGKRDDGKPLRAFLMEIPSELYQEDQASKQAALDEVDRAIRKGRLRSDGEEHRYVPDDGRGITVKNEVKRTPAAEAADD